MQTYYLDFKGYYPEMMEAVFKLFDAHGIPRERIIIATWSTEVLKGAQTSHPDVRRVLHIHYSRKPWLWA